MVNLRHVKVLAIQTILISLAFATPEPAVPSSLSNLTSPLLENRIVQNIRSAASSLAGPSSKPPSPSQATQQKMTAAGPATIRDVLKTLETQNAKIGDSCDPSLWNQHLKPIYDALYSGNKREQDMKNDEFALAILKDQSIISKVCLSASNFMECQGGKCNCLTRLPANLKYALDKCQGIRTGEGSSGGSGEGADGAGGGGAAGVLNVVLSFLQNLFAFNSGTSTSFGQVELIAVCLLGSLIHLMRK